MTVSIREHTMVVEDKRVALVTGGSRGIGLGIANALVREGWQLAINGVRPEQAVEQALAELRSAGANVIYCPGDVGISRDREAIMEKVIKHFGKVNLLVNNAGITSPGRADILVATEKA